MPEWPSISIGEVAEVFDGPHATPKTVDHGPVFLGISSLNNGRIELFETRHVTEADFIRWTKRVEPRYGDVVFSYETRLGEAAAIPKGLRCCLGRRMGLVRPDSDKLSTNYFLYFYLSPYFQEFLRQRTVNGATVDRIPLKDFPEFKIKLPPISEQDAITSTLETLDKKIELNRQMNETLEASARALFRDWFVDFGPTTAKMAGATPYLAPDLWALFPYRLDDDGAPAGWRRSTIGKEVSVVGGSTPSTKNSGLWNGDIAWTTPKDLSGLQSPVLLETARSITEAGLAKISSGLLPVGTVLLSSRAPVGYLAVTQIPMAVNQGYIAMKCEGRISNWFAFLWAKQNMSAILQNANGSTFQEISKKNFRPLSMLVGDDKIHFAFDSIVEPLFERIVANELENRTLAQTRDLLLPKLMSGEIRIRDAEQTVSEVV